VLSAEILHRPGVVMMAGVFADLHSSMVACSLDDDALALSILHNAELIKGDC
jgi:hypothetical protein